MKLLLTKTEFLREKIRYTLPKRVAKVEEHKGVPSEFLSCKRKSSIRSAFEPDPDRSSVLTDDLPCRNEAYEMNSDNDSAIKYSFLPSTQSTNTLPGTPMQLLPGQEVFAKYTSKGKLSLGIIFGVGNEPESYVVNANGKKSQFRRHEIQKAF